MGKKFYDEFARKGLKDMAQSISDMTYSYQDTIVPSKHYEEVLKTEIVELMSQDPNIEMNLLAPYFKIMTELKEENPKYFFKALLLLEMKLKPEKTQSVHIDALDYLWNSYDSTKPKDRVLLNTQIVEGFKDIEQNGLTVESDKSPNPMS